MRILHYAPRILLSEGGVTRAVLDMCLLLAERGHEVTLLCQEGKDAPRDWIEGAPNRPRVIETAPAGSALARFSKPQLDMVAPFVTEADVIHLHAMWQPEHLQIVSVAGCRPYVLTPHGHLDRWSMSQSKAKKIAYMALFGRRLLRGASCVHCTAKGELDQACAWFDHGKGRVVPLPFDTSDFEHLPGRSIADRELDLPGGPLVLFLSRLHYKKGPEILIDAIRLLGERGVGASLVFAGTGEDQYVSTLRARCAEAGIAEQVRFLGLVTGECKLSLYQRADVLALPTSQENFGLVFPESLACGTPVVTTKGVDIWPELEASGGAIIAERTAVGFAHAVERLLVDPALCENMGERGRLWVFQALDPYHTVNGLERMYQEMIRPSCPDCESPNENPALPQ